MKPKLLHLQNFKAVGKDASAIELAPITLLFGPNSAGKSTILQALIYLRELLLHRNYDPDLTTLGGEWLDLGGFRNLVHKRDLEDEIVISLTLELEEGDELPGYLSEHERESLEAASLETGVTFLPDEYLDGIGSFSVSLSIRWSEILEAPFAESIETSINDRRFSRVVSTADGKQVYFERLDLSHPVFSASQGGEDDTLETRLAQVLQPSVADREAYGSGLGELLNQERPFADRSLDELAELIEAETHRSKPVLREKLLAELNTRPSRKAAELRRLIDTATRPSKTEQELVYIGVQSQPDALPDPSQGIRLDSSIWVDKDDWRAELDQNFESADVNYSATKLLAECMISSLVAGTLRLVQDWVTDIFYIGPLRDLPPRNLQPQLTPSRSRWARGLAAWELIHSASGSVIKEMNYWLGENCLKTGYQLDVQRYRELPIDEPALTLLDREMEMDDQLLLKEAVECLPVRTKASLLEEQSGLSVMPQDIGVGISQLLPVVALAITQKTGVIAIEQPELHIHPAIQVELADLFARYALQHNKLFLLETHSEHLLLRLLRRIRESESQGDDGAPERGLRKEDISVQYVQSKAEGTHFERLRIDSDGDFIDEWPNGFFDERDEELF